MSKILESCDLGTSMFMFFTFFHAFVDPRIRSNAYRVNMRYVFSLPLDRS